MRSWFQGFISFSRRYNTAGRMQDNEPLMRALSKLINNNDPDLVLFVGEALVGPRYHSTVRSCYSLHTVLLLRRR